MSVGTSGRGPVFHSAKDTIKSMVATQTPFERVEAFIEDRSGLDEDERAVLWLYAWCGAEPQVVAAELGRSV